ncbi:hypothetical protein GGS23DRAFT_585291 [Durotheca rogersii]|uniref:uncharacterized protein n=1 Tax=Durotheca rogersii TaxID=419775 RepID=UPI00221FCD0D|nr:uncharacterized protein GGS23DRAFT_585291 [Durotheca rogersii]KAI5859631.1 hypothetical protein GGS23DRAFT_585291 [Durotheca rogersii]
MALIGFPRGLRSIVLPVSLLAITLVALALYHGAGSKENFLRNLPNIHGGGADKAGAHENHRPTNTHPPPKYKPTPTYLAPSVVDPWPLLAKSTATAPPIPEYNVPRPGLHREYGLSYMPPLFIGFTRQWPMLLQCIVSYLTAGWPPESIFVVENTGVQDSNARDKLSLQNPFYLNHVVLRRLGVNIIQTPVLLTFSQMQNFFLSTAHSRSWPYYFYSHQDVLVLSFEDGPDTMKRPGDRDWFFYDEEDETDIMRPAAAGQRGYRTIYENCLRELNRTLEHDKRWAFRWFQYDHLTLVNRAALDAVGGWDSLMPYYGSDCDMNARLEMDGWSMRHRRVGIINDVSTVLVDLAALYRDPNVSPKFIDPNPIPETEDMPGESSGTEGGKQEEAAGEGREGDEEAKEEKTDGERRGEGGGHEKSTQRRRGDRREGASGTSIATAIEYFRELVNVGNDMGAYKYRDENKARNSWQSSQRGGVGEPYYYNSDGFSKSFWILAEAGREVFRQKWGHQDCDLVKGTALKLEDQWLVEKDWEG